MIKKIVGLLYLLNDFRNGGGAGKIIAGTVAAVAAGVGGVFGYSYYDPEFRRKIEDTVPPMKSVFQPILGEPQPPKPLLVLKEYCNLKKKSLP